jgi:response regulator RpfG family c-di-GMP phosphodiesterase
VYAGERDLNVPWAEGSRMEEKNSHSVLVIDDESQVVRAIGRILKKEEIRFVSAQSAEEGLSRLEEEQAPFSLIISDQRMPGMTGARFFEKVKEQSPETVRFLLTGYSDMDALIDAVNRGAIHRYIKKPWNTEQLVSFIKEGLEQYEGLLENKRLMKQTKRQNAKLYKFNMELKKKTEAHEETLSKLDQEIEKQGNPDQSLQKKDDNKTYDTATVAAYLKAHDLTRPEILNMLYQDLLVKLFRQFQQASGTAGFEMPGPE